MTRFQVRKKLLKASSGAAFTALESLGIGQGNHRKQAMKFVRNTATTVVATVVTSTALGMVGTSAMAFSVTQNNNSSTLLNSLLGNTTGLSNFNITTTGNANAFGLFNDDPFGLGQGVVLSTGAVTNVVGPNNSEFRSTDFPPPGVSGDATQINISFNADSTASQFFFNYVFGSEEFLEFAGSGFNDSFQLSLNGTNLALLSNGNPVTIDNLAASPIGPFDPAFINNTNGIASNATQLDGYTQVLTFVGALNQNATNTLSLRIQDVGDGVFDSAVFIRGNSLGVTPPGQPVPEPFTILGSLTAGGIGVALRRKRQQQEKETAKV